MNFKSSEMILHCDL